MSVLLIPATQRTPELAFDPDAGHLRIAGESFPEDVNAFFDGPMGRVNEWLDESQGPVLLDFQMIYLNSSSAKVFVKLLVRLDAQAALGRDCRVRWWHDAEDFNIRELGEEFRDRVDHLRFELCEAVAGDTHS
ncbi:MAG: DUF1987 domain-containing protein [Burkholderiales bacterium]|nr:DUF1987 domain-containing protein [Burkholderiales bacterium]